MDELLLIMMIIGFIVSVISLGFVLARIAAWWFNMIEGKRVKKINVEPLNPRDLFTDDKGE
jgi:hypothetical protein